MTEETENSELLVTEETEASELRHRRGVSSTTPNTSHNAHARGVSTAEKAEKYVLALSQTLPESLRGYVVKVSPYIGQAAEGIEKCIPYVELVISKYHEIAKKLQPYKLELLLPALFGLVMCFFGGSFLTLISAFEAYRISGWKPTSDAVVSLYDAFQECVKADEKDNKKDDDADGTLDVLEISPAQLLARKSYLFVTTVDPKRITTALTAINSGFMAVIATLKLQFAKAVTLGASIGETLQKPALQYLKEPFEKILPPDFKQWAEPVIIYTVKAWCISIAWTLQRIVSAFHSALRGGVMVSRNVLDYMSVMGYYHVDHSTSQMDEIAGYVLAAAGFWFQLSWGFRLPFLLSILLFPLSIAVHSTMDNQPVKCFSYWV